MKKSLFFLLFLLFLLTFSACREGTPASTEAGTSAVQTTDSSVQTTPSSPHTTLPVPPQTPPETIPQTTAPSPVLPIPRDYYAHLDRAIACSSILIPAAYNEGIAYDIKPYFNNGTICFFLPSRADLSQVVYHVYDSKGNFSAGRVADFTSDGMEGKQVLIFGEIYPIVAYRSDSPTLYLELDESYGTMEEVRNDETKETKAYGTLLLESRDEIAAAYGWKPSYQSRENDAESPCTMYVKGRGNWSWLSTEKQGYSIKLETKDDLLGMGKSKKWALIANVPDPTMLRNTLAFYLGKAAEMPYTSSAEIVDLFVNGEYYGSFLLSEKVDIETERVNINDLEEAIEDLMTEPEAYGRQRTVNNRQTGLSLKYWTDVPDPEDITGGYILEMEMADRYQNEPSGFRTRRNFYYVIKSPEYASYEQVLYIATLVQEMEDALFAEDGLNPTTKRPYTDYLDLDSAVKKYWIDEISKNHDSVKTSAYFYKDADNVSEKLYMGPVWDYDIAFGISSETTDPQGWYSAEKTFYAALWQHESFVTSAKACYTACFYPALCAYVEEEVDKQAEKIAASVMMNDLLWKELNHDYFVYVERLKTYLKERAEWLLAVLSNDSYPTFR